MVVHNQIELFESVKAEMVAGKNVGVVEVGELLWNHDSLLLNIYLLQLRVTVYNRLVELFMV